MTASEQLLKETQDIRWSELSEGEREQLRHDYRKYDNNKLLANTFVARYRDAFEQEYGRHNLMDDLMNWVDVYKELFYDSRLCYVIDDRGYIVGNMIKEDGDCPNNLLTRNQGQKIIAMIKIMNVAVYVNGPEWRVINNKEVFFPAFDTNRGEIVCLSGIPSYVSSFVFFKSKDAFNRAKDILGEETFRLALSVNWWQDCE